MPNYAPGTRVVVHRIRDEEHEKILAALPVELTIEGAFNSYEGASWFCRMDPGTYLGREMGSQHMSGYEGVFGCFFFEDELLPAGPPETTRQMSYYILSQLK